MGGDPSGAESVSSLVLQRKVDSLSSLAGLPFHVSLRMAGDIHAVAPYLRLTC
jgi:hypothetical protein